MSTLAAKPQISLRGPFLWLWGAWTAALYYGILAFALAWWQGYELAAHAVFLVWVGAAFLPIEIVGAALNARTPGDQEVARTFSQFMQFMAHRTPGHLWWRGWNGFVTANAVIVGFVVGVSTLPLFLALGETFSGQPAPVWLGAVLSLGVSVLVFWWNFHHWQQRERYG